MADAATKAKNENKPKDPDKKKLDDARKRPRRVVSGLRPGKSHPARALQARSGHQAQRLSLQKPEFSTG
ncbi:MAG: hypothetical protein HY242_03565 [Afipia sp.]|nr:hypothetical protein [Afipia sp.]